MIEQPLNKEEYLTLMKTSMISTLLTGIAQLSNKSIEEIENSCIELCLKSLSKIREDEEANYQLYLDRIKNE